MNRQLYHEEIKRLAENTHGVGRLPQFSGRASMDSPMCGDRITVDVRVEDGVVAETAHEVQGCLLCRAAASALVAQAAGATLDELEGIRRSARAMLQDDAPPPAGWEVLEAFVPARADRSRHQCILLPFDALLAALRSATN